MRILNPVTGIRIVFSGPRKVSPSTKTQALFIIGDVHGCLDELDTLVSSHHHTQEQIVFVGDLTMKGVLCFKLVLTRNHFFPIVFAVQGRFRTP